MFQELPQKSMYFFVRYIIKPLLWILIGGVVISYFWKDSPTKTEISLPEKNPKRKIHPRFRRTYFSLALHQVNSYNYVFLNQLQGKSPSSSFLTVPPFLEEYPYLYLFLELPYAGIFEEDYSYSPKKLKDLIAYYKAKKVIFSAVKFSSSSLHPLSKKLSVNYAENSPRVKRALEKQFEVAFLLLKDNPYRLKDIQIEIGFIPSTIPDKRRSLQQAARNLLEAYLGYQRKTLESNFRILLKNSDFSSNNPSTLGVLLEDLAFLREEFLRLNRFRGNPIPDAEKKICFLLDISSLISAWKEENSPYYKEEEVPISSKKMLEHIQKVYGENLCGLFISYHTLWEEGASSKGKLPLTRASDKEFLLSFLNWVGEIYQISSIGKKSDGFIYFNIERGEMFPIIHRVFAPLADRLSLYWYSEGASTGEILDSIELLYKFLQQKNLLPAPS